MWCNALMTESLSSFLSFLDREIPTVHTVHQKRPITAGSLELEMFDCEFLES